jgi:hypothetical protein
VSTFSTKLQDLNAGEFLDVVGDVVTEQTRRSTNRDPSTMTDSENRQWAADQIRKAEQAKAEAARKAAEDGEG